MTTSPRSSTRRHLALMSATDREELSSMRILVWFRASAGGHLLPVALIELAGDQLLLSTKRLVGDQAHGQLLPAHLQGEKRPRSSRRTCPRGAGCSGPWRSCPCRAGRPAGSGRTCSGRRWPVQVPQSGGQAGHRRVAGGQLIEPVIHIQQHRGDGCQSLGGPPLPDGVDPLLRRLQHVLAGLCPAGPWRSCRPPSRRCAAAGSCP